MGMTKLLEHPVVSELNRKGYIGPSDSMIFGIDVFGDEIFLGDDVVIDGSEMILRDNLERYLSKYYGFEFKTAE